MVDSPWNFIITFLSFDLAGHTFAFVRLDVPGRTWTYLNVPETVHDLLEQEKSAFGAVELFAGDVEVVE